MSQWSLHSAGVQHFCSLTLDFNVKFPVTGKKRGKKAFFLNKDNQNE